MKGRSWAAAFGRARCAANSCGVPKLSADCSGGCDGRSSGWAWSRSGGSNVGSIMYVWAAEAECDPVVGKAELSWVLCLGCANPCSLARRPAAEEAESARAGVIFLYNNACAGEHAGAHSKGGKC